MTTHARGRFEITSWDEQPYDEIDGGAKLTRASVTQTYHGDIEGEGKVDYLMVYDAGGAAGFVAVERLTGRIEGRSGSIVLQGSGTFRDGTAKGTWHVVPGAGMGDLRGLRGEGGFLAGSDPHGAELTLDYEFTEQQAAE